MCVLFYQLMLNKGPPLLGGDFLSGVTALIGFDLLINY
jgi:hypothetical protein